MNVSDPKIYIDHIDNNKLNNSKTNLRLSNAQKNSQNKTKAFSSISKYVGLTYDKKRNKWVSKIIKNNKPIFTAYDKNEDVCARKRDLFILVNLKNDHYKLNFVWSEEDIAKWKLNFENQGYSIKILK